MRFFLLFIFLLPDILLTGQKKQVCFSIDDLPVVSYGITDTVFQKELADKLVKGLKKNRIPAIGFVNEIKLYEDGKFSPFQAGLLKNWVNNGLELGNHTYSHPDYNSVSFDEFTRDLIKGEKITSEILKSKGKSLRYFRHPFLHVGDTKNKADSLSHFLAGHGYKVAPVTIDNDDYLFALAYKRTRDQGNIALMTKIGHDYIDYMERKVLYYEKQSQRLFGREISQILLIHASLLNAEYIDSLAAVFTRNHYDFVSMDNALMDKVYQTEVSVYMKMGISWVDRWAMAAGKKGDFFRDEPVTPDYIKKLSE